MAVRRPGLPALPGEGCVCSRSSPIRRASAAISAVSASPPTRHPERPPALRRTGRAPCSAEAQATTKPPSKTRVKAVRRPRCPRRSIIGSQNGPRRRHSAAPRPHRRRPFSVRHFEKRRLFFLRADVVGRPRPRIAEADGYRRPILRCLFLHTVGGRDDDVRRDERRAAVGTDDLARVSASNTSWLSSSSLPASTCRYTPSRKIAWT
jgi:hypothetical protein